MKLNGFVGKGTGKLGSSVFAVSGGEQIVRQYNPNVSNPNTQAQSEQRAKFKLLSQIAADLSAGIAIPKDGLKSARNQFVALNYPLAFYADNKAQIDLPDLQLTKGSQDMPLITVTPGSNNTATAKLQTPGAGNFDRVVYVAVHKNENEKLQILGIVTAEKGQNNDFEASVPNMATGMLTYAYGVKFSSPEAKVRFDNYVAQVADEYATLTFEIPTSLTGATFTRTTCG